MVIKVLNQCQLSKPCSALGRFVAFLLKLMKQNFMLVQTDLNWLYIYPKGIHHLVTYVKDNYKNPPMYITENGKTVYAVFYFIG